MRVFIILNFRELGFFQRHQTQKCDAYANQAKKLSASANLLPVVFPLALLAYRSRYARAIRLSVAVCHVAFPPHHGMVKTISWSVTPPDPGFNDPAAR